MPGFPASMGPEPLFRMCPYLRFKAIIQGLRHRVFICPGQGRFYFDPEVEAIGLSDGINRNENSIVFERHLGR